MRIGTCPERVKRDFVRAARVSVCIVVHIPHQLDYYAQRLDVLRLCLTSLGVHTPRDRYDLLVLDNGSCDATVDYLRELRDRGAIDHLILSARNVGKINACRMLFDAAPGELVAYADDDVWFGPDWLESQLALLDTYPRVGMVSARPVRRQFRYGNVHLDDYLTACPDIRVERGRFIPEAWEDEFERSLGRLERRPGPEAAEVRLEYRGLRAYATATHFQFLAPKTVIQAAMRSANWQRPGISEERRVEEAVEAMGYARLSTDGRHVRHIGNVISRTLREEIGDTTAEMIGKDGWRPSAGAWVRFTQWRPVRALLARLNRWTYQLLHHP